ncbi:MAG: nucleotidyltransferase family protein, partial [Mycobacteriales bacterium]
MSDAHDLARRLIPELVERGALAVAITGSHARGDATDRSDLDLMVVGDGPDYLLEMREGVLVAQAWASEPEHRAQMSDPGRVG